MNKKTIITGALSFFSLVSLIAQPTLVEKIEAKEAKTKFELSGKELFLLSVGETREI